MGGSCYDEEDFVKSFLPSLFDSDSEADETFLSVKSDTFRSFPDKPLHVHLGRPMKKTTSSEAFSKVQSYNKRMPMNSELTIKEELTEASSPSSQGNSNTSTRTPFSRESGDSVDCSSPFYSVLSFESSDTAYDFEPTSFRDDSPSPVAKRQKVTGSVMLRNSPLTVSCSVSNSCHGLRPDASPASTIVSAHSVPSPLRLMPQTPTLMPRLSLPVQPHLPYMGSVTTGIPVDSHPSEISRAWAAPQAMIPTHPSNTSFYASQFGGHIPSNLPAPVISMEKIAASLREVKKAPIGAPSPLGLKLDKSSLASSLQALGMVLRD